MEPTTFDSVNLGDPRQDVHRVRDEQVGLSRHKVAETLLPADPRGLKVLEIGGGAAEFSRRMQALGIQVTFVDLSPNNVKRATSYGMAAHQLDLNCGLPVFQADVFDG